MPPGAPALTRGTPDPRRWIYGGLDLTFAIAQAVLLWMVVPNRLPSAAVHLWALPLALAVMGAGTLWGGRRGWLVAVAAGSVVLLGLVLLILRIIVSSAFLAGVYGAFGQGAAMTGLLAVALLVELVGLLPIAQIRFLMSRAGRRAYAVQARLARAAA